MVFPGHDDDRVEMGLLRNISDTRAPDESSSSDFSDGDAEPRTGNFWRRPKVVVVGAVAVAAVLAIAGYSATRSGPSDMAQVSKGVGYAEKDTLPPPGPNNNTVAQQLAAQATILTSQTSSTVQPSATQWGSQATSAISTTAAPVTPTQNQRRKPTGLKPDENMHDGNTCDDTEELYGGLCYTKCSVLTQGTHPYRSTAFSCCEIQSCATDIFKLKTASLIPCHGYDVSAPEDNHACPHLPGACLNDEEMFLGECFEKCSTLTNGEFPNRVAAASCCKEHGLACFDPLNDKTSASFAVGGGQGDHDASTPSGAHFPSTQLTER